jgi:histidyl-tRNA synthetase
VVRLSDRDAWAHFAKARGVPEERTADLLGVVDKLERARPEESAAKLAEFGVTPEDVRAFIATPGTEARTKLDGIHADLRARGLETFVEIDLTIVRGLAYYTGTVFEIFDRAKNERALAGGGRYDGLLATMSDGKVSLPALGFGMGDVVLGNLIADTPRAKARMDAWVAAQHAVDIFVVVAKEERRADALALVQQLRDAGQRVDFPLSAAKVGKQFQTAETLGARCAVLVGDEWPQVKLKTLATREEVLVPHGELLGALRVPSAG